MSNDFTPHDDANDPTAARLRAALNVEAAMVQPDDQLSSIRERTADGDRPWWRHPAALAVAAAVVLGVAAGGAAALLGGDDDPTRRGRRQGLDQQHRRPRTPATPSETASTSEGTATPTPAVPVEGNVYVYYAMVDDKKWRLYREERPNIGMDPATMALTTMFSEPAMDPDYAVTWPRERPVTGYSSKGDTATVDLDVARWDRRGRLLLPTARLHGDCQRHGGDEGSRARSTAGRLGHDWSAPIVRAPLVRRPRARSGC